MLPKQLRSRSRAFARASVRAAAITLGLGALSARGAHAQSSWRLDSGGLLEVGGEGERYLRALQVAGIVPLSSGWTIQPFSPSDAATLVPTGPNPWSARFAARDTSAFRILRPYAELVGNTAYPFQIDNGPAWDGRGLTAQVQAGVAGSWRFVHAQFAPLAFVAQNAAFALARNGQAGRLAYADPRFPGIIDAPQRFGNSAYSRLTPGTSYLTVDLAGVSAGFTTAPQRWGPEREYPLVLGPNAGGFPNVFIGTSKPVNLWFARAQMRLEYGQLTQSAFSPVDTGDTRRFASGVVGTLSPRGLPGLELGLSRFIHRPWTGFPSFTALRRPFSGVISTNLNGVNVVNENQVASAFARWALPGAKAEFYGEFYKEDFPGAFHVNASSFVDKPDDLSSFALGFQRVLVATGSHMRVLRGEIVNGETSHQERGQRGFTAPIPPYVHASIQQGHTYDGMLLGSPEAYGGSGWRFGLDDFTPSGRRSVSFERFLRFDWLPTNQSTTNVHPDVIYGLRFDAVRFRGAEDLGLTVVPSVDLNRNLSSHHDVFNLSVGLSARGWP